MASICKNFIHEFSFLEPSAKFCSTKISHFTVFCGNLQIFVTSALCTYVRMSDRAFPIARALDLKADVVITGRCVDSALVLGPLIHKVNTHCYRLAHIRANTEEWCVFTPGAYLTTISCYSYNISVYSAYGTYKCWEKLIN